MRRSRLRARPNVPMRALRPIASALRGGLAVLACLRLRASSARVGLALCYHGVEPEEGDPARELSAPVGSEVFRRQLRHLRRWYRMVPASALPGAVAERARWQRIAVAITFDDDLASHVEHAVPALEEFALPATFFLTGATIDRRAAFWWQLLQAAWDRGLLDGGVVESWGVVDGERAATIRDVARAVEAMAPTERDAVAERLRELLGDAFEPATLTREQIAALARRRFEIGFHTKRHDDLLGLADEAVADAMVVGRSDLEQLVGRPLRVISYPHGRADARVARCAAAAGFVAGYVADGTAVSAASDPHLLGRRYPARGSIGAFAFDLVRALRTADR